MRPVGPVVEINVGLEVDANENPLVAGPLTSAFGTPERLLT